jgi:hypothetical protein
VKIVERAAGITASPHSARAMKAMKVLNFVGTVRGAATTVLLAASMVGGGAVTVNQVRQEIAPSTSAPRATAARTNAPTPTPLTATSLLADLQLRLQNTLAADASAADELRKVAVFSGPRLDQLVDETKQRLQARYDQGIVQLTGLITGSASPSPATSGTTRPSSSPSVIAANALLTVIVGDLNTIVVQATRAATEPTPIPRTLPPTIAPTVAPTVAPRTPSPAPSPTRSASPRPSATR